MIVKAFLYLVLVDSVSREFALFDVDMRGGFTSIFVGRREIDNVLVLAGIVKIVKHPEYVTVSVCSDCQASLGLCVPSNSASEIHVKRVEMRMTFLHRLDQQQESFKVRKDFWPQTHWHQSRFVGIPSPVRLPWTACLLINIDIERHGHTETAQDSARMDGTQ